MKKLLLLGLVLCFMVSIAGAQPVDTADTDTEPTVTALDLGDILNKLPPLKQGLAYSIENNDLNYLSTIEIVQWKGLTLEGGYALPDALVGVLSYRLAGLADLGVTLPVLELLEFNIGFYAGIEDIDDEPEFDYGPAFTLINVKF